MSKFLLGIERHKAEKALFWEDKKYLLEIGEYQPTLEELCIFFWEVVMPHDCQDKGAEIRNQRQHKINERLDRIEPEVMSGESGFLRFFKERPR